MPQIRLPDGSYYEARDGEDTPEKAKAGAMRRFPEAFDTSKPEEGFAASAKASLMRTGAGLGLAGSGLGVIDEQTARAANAATEEQIRKHVYKPVEYEGGDDSVKGALAKYGWWNATPEGQPGADAPGGGVQLLKFWRDQLGAMAPQAAGTMAGAWGGAALGAMTGNPVGAGVGALLGGAAANIPFFQGSNLQAQVEQQKTTGEAPLEHGRALAAAIPQSMSESVQQLFVLGRGLGFGKKALDALAGRTAAEQTAAMVAKANENLAKAVGKGVVRGVATEVPVELSQQVLERWQSRQDLLGPDAMKDYEQTAVGTLGPAALLGGVGGAHGRYSAGRERDESEQKTALEDRKAKQAEADALRRAPETIAATQTELEKLNQRYEALQRVLARPDIKGADNKGKRGAVSKEVNSVVTQMRALHGSLTEVGATPAVDVPDKKKQEAQEQADVEAMLAQQAQEDAAAAQGPQAVRPTMGEVAKNIDREVGAAQDAQAQEEERAAAHAELPRQYQVMQRQLDALRKQSEAAVAAGDDDTALALATQYGQLKKALDNDRRGEPQGLLQRAKQYGVELEPVARDVVSMQAQLAMLEAQRAAASEVGDLAKVGAASAKIKALKVQLADFDEPQGDIFKTQETKDAQLDYRELEGFDPQNTGYRDGLEQLHSATERDAREQEAAGAELAAKRADALLQYAPLEFRGPGKQPYEPERRKKILTNIDSGILDRDVQNALGLSELSRTHELDNPDDVATAAPVIAKRIADLESKRDALMDPKVELTNADGTFTKAGAQAVSDEMRLGELRRLQKRLDENAEPDRGSQLLDTFITRAKAEEEGPADLIHQSGVPEHHEEGVHRYLERQNEAYDEFRDALDDVKDGAYLGGENGEAATSTRTSLVDKARASAKKYVNAALRHSAHYRALKGLAPINKTEAIRAAERMQEQFDDVIKRSTVQPELIHEPARMRADKIVRPARSYWGYPSTQPYAKGEYREVVGGSREGREARRAAATRPDDGFAKWSGPAKFVPLTGDGTGSGRRGGWEPAGPKSNAGSIANRVAPAPRALNDFTETQGKLREALASHTSTLKREKKGETFLRKKELTQQFASELSKEHAAARKELPTYRDHVSGLIRDELARSPSPDVEQLLRNAQDVLDANRGTREFVENVDYLLNGLRRGYADPQLLDQLAGDIETERRERGSESPRLVKKKEREATVAEKQPDLFDAEPRVNVSIRQAEEELAQMDAGLEQFKGRKLDLAGMKAWRTAVAERDNVETRLMILRNAQEAEGGSGFVGKGTDVAAGATIQSTAKKFMKFLQSPGVRALKDFFSPGWRALKKAEVADKEWESTKRRLAAVDARIDMLNDDPRFKKLPDPRPPELPFESPASPQEVQANMRAFAEWKKSVDAFMAERKAAATELSALLERRKALMPVQQGGQERRRPAHSAERAAAETGRLEVATVLNSAYDESRALYQSLRNVQDDKEIQQARAIAADLRAEIAELKKQSPQHQWAAEANKRMADEVEGLDKIAKEYEDRAAALEKARLGDFDAAMVRANALATREVQVQKMALERREKALEKAARAVEKPLRVPTPIVREMDAEELDRIRKTPEYKAELKAARKAVLDANKALKTDPGNTELQAAVAAAKKEVQAVELGQTNVWGYGETYMADVVEAEKNEIQKQRAALAAAERKAEADREQLRREREAFEQRKAEHFNQKVTTAQKVMAEGEDELEVGGKRTVLKAVRKDKKLETRKELNEQRDELREELAALNKANPDVLTTEKRALTGQIIKLTNRLKNHRNDVVQPAEVQKVTTKYPDASLTKEERAKFTETPAVGVYDAPATRESEVVPWTKKDQKAYEQRTALLNTPDAEQGRFPFQNAPHAETNAANAEAAKTLKFKGDLPERENPTGKLRTAKTEEATALTKKQRAAQAEVDKDIEAARKGKFDPDAPLYSKGEAGEPTGHTVAGVQEALMAKFNVDPAKFNRLVSVVQSEADLPAEIRNAPNFEAGKTRGVTHRGRVWLVADNIAVGQEEGVFAHEAGAHIGFDKILTPNDRLWLRKQIEGWARRDDQVGEIAREALENAEKEGAAVADEEAIAYAAEKLIDAGVTPSTPSAEGGWLRRLFNAFENALKKVFGRKADFTPADLVNMARGAAKVALDEFGPGDGTTSTRFSKAAADPELRASVDKIVAQDKTFLDKLRDFAAGFHQNMVDSQGPFHTALAKAVKAGVMDVKNAVQASYFVRQIQRAHYWTALALSDGVPSVVTNKDGDKEIVGQGKVSAKDVVDALNPLMKKYGSSKELFREFTFALAAKRAEELGPGGKEKLNFGPDVTDADLARGRALFDQHPEFRHAAEKYKEYNDALIDFVVGSGALTKEQGDALKQSKYYMPYYREGGDHALDVHIDAGKPIKIGSIKNSPYLHELVGGESKILSFEDAIQQNTALLTGMALQNLASRSAAFELASLGLANIATGSKSGPNVIHFNIEPEGPNDTGRRSAEVGDGAQNVRVEKLEKELSRIPPNSRAFDIVRAKLDRVRESSGLFGNVSGELLVKSMEGLSTSIAPSMRILAAPANLLRKGVTRNPLYAVRQMIRDPFSAWFSTGTNINPLTTAFKEVAKIYSGHDEEYVEAQRRGMIGGQVFNGDAEDVKKLMKLHLETGGTGTFWSVLDNLAMRSDGATRVALMRDFEKQGLSRLEATMATNASMDFTRRGSSQLVHMASMMIPFLNAQIQGLDVVYKALSGNMSSGEKTQAAAKLAKRAAILVGATIAYVAMMKDDEAYKNASPFTRLNNFFVRVPGLKEPLKIPIPFEFGFMFKSVPETLMLAASKDYKVKPLIDGLGQATLNMLPGGSLVPMPQFAKPIYEAYFNKEAYSGLPITTQAMSNIAPEYRVGPRTSEIAKLVGGVTGKLPGGQYMSPVMLDHFINGYLGGIGTNATALASLLMPWSLVRKENAGPVAKKMSELPFLGGAFQANTGMGLVNQAHEMAIKLEEAQETYRKLVDKDPEEAKKYLQNNKTEIAQAPVARAFMGRISALDKMIHQIEGLPRDKMAPEEKLRRIEILKRQKIKVAEGANKAF